MIELLKKFAIFEGMTEGELQEMAKICGLRKLKKGEQLFKAGDIAEFLFMVDKGGIELRFTVTYYNASTEISLDKIREGEAFGWSALIDPFKYTLSAFVTEDSELVEIRENQLKRVCQENCHLGYKLMNNIARLIGQRFAKMQEILIQEIQQGLKKKESLS